MRTGAFAGPTAGRLLGVAQANLVAVPADWADELAAFAVANPPAVSGRGPHRAGRPAPAAVRT